MAQHTAITHPAAIAENSPTAAILEAPPMSLRPRARDIKLPEPWPKKKATAWIRAMYENTIPRAAVDCVSILPT